MKKLISMREALASDRYFATYLAGESWSAWRAILLAVMGEELNTTERVTFTMLTGREREPVEHVREIMAVVGRRGGKSRAASVLGAFIAGCCDHRAVLAPGERGVLPILAASTRQAQQLFNFTAGIFASVPAFKGLVNDSTADTLRLKSGVDVQITTASWRTVRSITAVSAICDELAFWRSDDSVNPDEEIVGALKPALLTTGGMLIGISSPHSKKGVLWNSFRRNFGEGCDPRKLVIQAPSLTLNPSLPQDEIDLAYEEDPAKAAAEYGGQFRNDLESYVDRQILERLVTPGVIERAPVAGVKYQSFADMSGGSRDSAALAIGHQSGTRFTLDLMRERKAPHSPESVTEEFAGLLMRYGLSTVTGDAYAGRFPADAYLRHGITYRPSERNRSQIYTDFLPRLNSGEVDLLDVPIVLNQLASLERRTARGGRDSIDHPPGGRDDCANAVAGVLSMPLWRRSVAQIGSYSIHGDDRTPAMRRRPIGSSGANASTRRSEEHPMNHPSMFSQLKGRLKPQTAYVEHYGRAIDNIAGVSAKLDQERQRINADVSLSTEGKRQALARVAKTMARDLAEASRPMRKGFESVQATRASFKPDAISRNDIAGELKRAEIRAFLSELSGPKRIAAAMEIGKSREGQLAIIDAHPLLTGLPEEIHAEIREMHLSELHGSAMAEVAEHEEDLRNIAAAFDSVKTELQAASLMTAQQFAEHIAPMQKRIDGGPLAPEPVQSDEKPLFGFDAEAFDARFDQIVADVTRGAQH